MIDNPATACYNIGGREVRGHGPEGTPDAYPPGLFFSALSCTRSSPKNLVQAPRTPLTASVPTLANSRPRPPRPPDAMQESQAGYRGW